MTRGSTSASNDGLALEVVRATRRYGRVVALDEVTVAAARGEFLTILGQSGSGKTTLLRLIGGLDHPTSIEALRIGSVDVLKLPPHKRNVATVFQHYALFPHMSVGRNVAYPLLLRGVEHDGATRQAREMLETVRLGDKFDRRVHQLSGGERQRVALARAIICRPDVLLLDEPLGALDERLRLDMQIELLQLQRHFGMTFVYITHSQEEALTMSDRIVLMRHGRVAQEGPPRNLFECPVSDFVGTFMGIENVISGTVAAVDGKQVKINAAGGSFGGLWTGLDAPQPGSTACLMVRAEKARVVEAGKLTGRVAASVYKGRHIETVVQTPQGPFHVLDRERQYETSAAVSLNWDESDAKIAPIAT